MKLPFAPDQASSLSGHVDLVYLYLIAVTLFFTALIFILVTVFAVKYRRRSEDEQPKPVKVNYTLEIVWTVIPILISLTIFFWGGLIFYKQYHPPENAQVIFVVGKQWMWKIQHPEGRREINELHLAVGQPVKLIMTSEDVIHSFYVPAFRTKMDVLPGKYTSEWFNPTKPGTYHLFCAEYCGTKHSQMVGWVTVMEPDAYEQWLQTGNSSDQPLRVAGERLFQKHRCNTCHTPGQSMLGPEINFGSRVKLADGRTVTANEDYIRESILKPAAKVVAGYAPIMPTYQGQVSEEEIMQMIEYIKTSYQAQAKAPAAAFVKEEAASAPAAVQSPGDNAAPEDRGNTAPENAQPAKAS